MLPTTIRPAGLANPRISSRGSSEDRSRSGRRTPTRIVFSRRSKRSVLLSSIKVGMDLAVLGRGECWESSPGRRRASGAEESLFFLFGLLILFRFRLFVVLDDGG